MQHYSQRPNYGISLGACKLDKENMVCIQSVVLFSHKEQNHVILRKMTETGGHHVE
jgi:hypothetical protein